MASARFLPVFPQIPRLVITRVLRLWYSSQWVPAVFPTYDSSPVEGRGVAEWRADSTGSRPPSRNRMGMHSLSDGRVWATPWGGGTARAQVAAAALGAVGHVIVTVDLGHRGSALTAMWTCPKTGPRQNGPEKFRSPTFPASQHHFSPPLALAYEKLADGQHSAPTSWTIPVIRIAARSLSRV